MAAQPGSGCEKGCRDDRRRMADDGRRSLMAEEAKSFRSYCLARKRSEKAKGRAGASPRAPATPWRPSAPLRLAKAGSSTTRLHLSGREEGLLPEDLGRRADGPPAACRLRRQRSRCRLFPLWRDFSANSMRRGMAAPAASLSSRIHRGERDKIGPVDTARRAQASGDERRDDQRRPHEGKPIPNSKRDGSYLRLRNRCCKGGLRGTAAQMAKRASSPLFADNLD